jgi:hypothetical protein
MGDAQCKNSLQQGRQTRHPFWVGGNAQQKKASSFRLFASSLQRRAHHHDRSRQRDGCAAAPGQHRGGLRLAAPDPRRAPTAAPDLLLLLLGAGEERLSLAVTPDLASPAAVTPDPASLAAGVDANVEE